MKNILRRTEKTVWLAEIHSQLIEDVDGFGQVGYMIPIDFIKGDVFYRRIQYSKYGDFDLKVSKPFDSQNISANLLTLFSNSNVASLSMFCWEARST